MRIVCIINPARRKATRVRTTVLRTCAALGLPQPTMMDTTVAEPGGPQAQHALELGADLVIAAGGDGTIRNVGSVLANTDVPLGVVPTGTANIFHLNTLGRARGLDTAVRTALLGDNTAVDIGNARLKFADGECRQQHFTVLVGIGRDAETLMRVSEAWKRRIGPLAYFAAGVGQLAHAPIPMRIEVDGRPFPRTAAWSVLIANCGRIPGGIAVIPQARVNDGLLNVLHVAPNRLPGWIPIGIHGLRKREGSVQGLLESPAREVTIIPEKPVAMQIDGDVWHDVVRLDVQIEPGALLVRTPQEPADDGT